MTMIKCAFYGTLRRPLYNHQRLVSYYTINAVKYRKTIDIPGFRMYAVHPDYPGVICTGDQKETITVDLVELSERAFDHVLSMELGAGYSEMDITIDNEKYIIFIYERSLDNCKRIEHGDFVGFVNTHRINDEHYEYD